MRQNTQIQVNCKLFLDNLAAENFHEFAIMGTRKVAEHLHSLTRKSALRIKGIYDSDSEGTFHEFKFHPVEDLAGYSGKVVMGTHEDMENRVNLLKSMGISSDRIIVLK